MFNCIGIQVRMKKRAEGSICNHKREFLFSIVKLPSKFYVIIKLHFPNVLNKIKKLRTLFYWKENNLLYMRKMIKIHVIYLQ